ncbi:hypothetical protein [Pseudomonas baetica]|uniref:hypothetical protein n=1 Tax=Pseudomonas baetica TaxID=674054 RepID=UPI002405ECB6|nr:hypothetical protein [Pseudomonas baetica]MDF9773331.1 hypothetical protein [Pseudomonas baetica]
MKKTRTVQTDLFEAKSKTGRVYVISEQTTQILTTFLDNSNTGWIDGSKCYKVRSGGSANKLSETDFHILASGEYATRL